MGGITNELLDPLVRPLGLTGSEIADLINFLQWCLMVCRNKIYSNWYMGCWLRRAQYPNTIDLCSSAYELFMLGGFKHT
jgi:hypothetical protein